MKLAIVAIEDQRFYEHRGVDIHGIMRAVSQDVRHKAVVEGGSTITQQFVKNTYTKDQRSIGRKLKEAALAWQLEQRWSKDRILTAYLNTIYFGNGAYGVQQAALTYFHHGADRLGWAEAALLAGIPSDPSRYDPVTNPKAARERRNLVLKAMLDQRDITDAEYANASKAKLPNAEEIHLSGERGPAPYFTNYVQQQLIDRYGPGRIFGGGLRVRTTIDLNIQRFARKSITKWLTDPNGPSAALVAVDPRDGERARDDRRQQLSQEPVQPRRPGRTPAGIVLQAVRARDRPEGRHLARPDVRLAAREDPGRRQALGRAQLRERVPRRISLETATTESDNSVYAQLTQLVGPARSCERRKLGITSPLKNYFAIGLGAEAVNPLEMARAFSAFDNGGIRIDGAAFGNHPRAISFVQNEAGRMVDNNLPVPRHALTANTAALVTCCCKASCAPGTGKRAQLSDGRPRPARPARPRTTATRGSSATRHSSSPRSGWATPLEPEADADRVPRRLGRRRNLSRADLEDVHGAHARRPARAAEGLPEHLAPLPVSCTVATGTGSSARQRQLQQHEAGSSTSPAKARPDGGLQGQRGRGAQVVGSTIRKRTPAPPTSR